MKLIVDHDGATWETDVRVHDPAATVGDLGRALGLGPDGAVPLVIGGRLIDPDVGLDEAGLHEGAVVTPRGGIEEAPRYPSPAELRIVGGLDSGASFPLPPGDTLIGREGAAIALDDRTVSRRHCVLSVTPLGDCTVTDLGSTNGTLLGDQAVGERTVVPHGTILWVGSVPCTIGPGGAHDQQRGIDPLRHARQSGTIPFNRPPRAAPPPPPEMQLAVPPPPAEASKPPFNYIAVIAPLLLGGTLVLVTGSIQFALFMLMSPVMMVGNWADGRFRSKKQGGTDARTYRDQIAALDGHLGQARSDEAARLWHVVPDIAEVVRRGVTPSMRLWERRPGYDDFLLLGAGVADVGWTLPLKQTPQTDPDHVARLAARHHAITAAPVGVNLVDGGVVGVVGPRGAALAVARSLVCQAVVHHGPADVVLTALLATGAAPDWDWLKWVPHLRDPERADSRLVATDPERCRELLDAIVANRPRTPTGGAALLARREEPEGPVRLLLVDDETLTEGRTSPTRTVLRGGAGPVAGVVIASDEQRLPAMCTCVIRVTDDGDDSSVTWPEQRHIIEGVMATGVSVRTARDLARALARFDDPEVHVAGAGLPEGIALLPLLGMGQPGVEPVLARWAGAGRIPAPAAPVGVSEEGVVVLDLARDGPHGLVAGTTGSGKSELLRSLVAGLAATVDPDHLTFVLVDYKGGSAFEACSQLPHTVGFVTDIDEQLGERALRCLEAELKYRERVLREAGATDLPDYLSRDPDEVPVPLPRLVVVIDEFATMAAELPDFLDALVGIAQRGRSLGVHLLLATQRPSGAVNQNIKANTNLRISLRVQDSGDSTDVIGVPDAARIPRGRAGRAYVRLGADELLPIQTALVTGDSADEERPPVEAGPFELAPASGNGAAATGTATAEDSRDNDLTRLVAAINGAAHQREISPPRRPWPEPLAASIPLAEVVAGGRPGRSAPIAFAMADDPDRQTQYPTGWSPHGNLVLYGIPGSGTTSTLASIVLSLVSTTSADDAHAYVLDFGSGDLGPLEALPHVGAVVFATQRERQVRLVRQLRAELDRRRNQGDDKGSLPLVVVVIDNIGGFLAEHAETTGLGVYEDFVRLWSDGPDLGMVLAVSADRTGALTHQLAALAEQRWLFRLGTPNDYALFGLRPGQVPRPAPGRAVVAGSAQVVQVAWEPDLGAAIAERVAATAPPARPAPAVGALPEEVPVAEVLDATDTSTRPWRLGIGLGDTTLGPVAVPLYEGEHLVIAGPPRTGRSTALRVVAEAARRHPDARVLGVALRRSPLVESPHLHDLFTDRASVAMLYEVVEASTAPHVILVDDAEAVDDEGSVFSKLLALRRPDLHIVIGGRVDLLRVAYSHWTKEVRRSRCGILFRPDPDIDGELLGVKLPRRTATRFGPGRGYLVDNGDLELVQVAMP